MFSGVRSVSNRMRLGFAVLLVMALSLSAPLGASAAGLGGGVVNSSAPALITRAANIVSRIVLSPRSGNVVLPFEKITMSFFYNTTWSMGVIVTAVPFAGTAPITTATNCTTTVLPVGAGTVSCAINIGASGVTVSSIRFQMWDATQKTLLFQASLPVYYLALGAANLAYAVGFSPANPSVQLLGKGVSVNFSYRTNQTAGVRVFVVPFTGTAPTPNYVTCASPIYPAGSGTGTCRFAIASGAGNVTSLHVQMWAATQPTVISQIVIPVTFRFRSGATLITNTTFTPITPNIARLGQNVYVHFLYQTSQSAGIVVEAIPYTGSTPTPNVTLTASPVLPTGSGKGSAAFMLTGSSTTVNWVRLNVWDSTHATLLFMLYLPVQYQFH